MERPPRAGDARARPNRRRDGDLTDPAVDGLRRRSTPGARLAAAVGALVGSDAAARGLLSAQASLASAVTSRSPHLGVVAGAAADQATRMAEGVRHLPRGAWYVDATGEAFARLELTGVPVVLALRHDTIEWTLSGLLPASGELRSILTTWLTN